MLESKYDLKQFNCIDLDQLNNVKLQNRKDTKYIFHENKLNKLLSDASQDYKILEINNNRQFFYESIYFDSDDFLLYNQHHNEKRSRYKIRFREYKTTGEVYFEIKEKNNKNTTVKKRYPVTSLKNTLDSFEKNLIKEIIDIDKKLNDKLIIEFNRITLANNDLTERLTIDTNLTVKNHNNKKSFNNLVVTEVKQKKYNPKSKFMKILKNLKIYKMRFSKYCIGTVHIYDNLKSNRFKPKLIQLNKVLNYN